MTEKGDVSLNMSNWHEFDLEIDDLETTDEQKAWNSYIVLKQAEINTMLSTIPNLRKGPRIDTLSSALPDGGSDPLPDR